MNSFFSACAAICFLSAALATPAFAQSATRTRLLTSPNPSNLGQPVTMTAEVDGLGGGAPTGRVLFKDGATSLGSAPLVAQGAGQAIIAAGDFHTCALTYSGGVKCWGWNAFGQLGYGEVWTRRARPPVRHVLLGVSAVSAGNVHSCALTIAGGIKCWGGNQYGQAGDGTTQQRNAPVDVIGLSSGVVALAGGANHTCALTGAGAVKCWGYNADGQIGDGSFVNRLVPTSVTGLTGIVAVEGGYGHTCALTNAGAVKCWGNNIAGQLGDGTITKRASPVDVAGLSQGIAAISPGALHTCALTRAGAAKCWGHNAVGELGDGTNMDRHGPVQVTGLSSGVAAIAAFNSFHTCALTIAGGVKCWGSNVNGQLGDGTQTSRNTPVDVFGLSSEVAVIGTGLDHSCALLRTGNLQCWGNNNEGQLGDGSVRRRITPVSTVDFTGLVRARAKVSRSTLGVGTHALTAAYPGDAAHLPSSGAAGHTVQ